jgi:hypothetical protein
LTHPLQCHPPTNSNLSEFIYFIYFYKPRSTDLSPAAIINWVGAQMAVESSSQFLIYLFFSHGLLCHL